MTAFRRHVFPLIGIAGRRAHPGDTAARCKRRRQHDRYRSADSRGASLNGNDSSIGHGARRDATAGVYR